MTSALSPPSALERLSEMSGHVREAILLDARGRRGACAPPRPTARRPRPCSTRPRRWSTPPRPARNPANSALKGRGGGNSATRRPRALLASNPPYDPEGGASDEV